MRERASLGRPDLVPGRFEQRADDPHERALARPVGTDQTVQTRSAGQVDAVLVDREFGHQSIDASEGRLSVLGSPIILEEGIGAGLREEDVNLKDKLNKAIIAMKADGSLNDLIRKWFDEDADTF